MSTNDLFDAIDRLRERFRRLEKCETAANIEQTRQEMLRLREQVLSMPTTDTIDFRKVIIESPPALSSELAELKAALVEKGLRVV